MSERRKFWGWGREAGDLETGEIEAIGKLLASRFEIEPHAPLPVPRIEDVGLPATRLTPPQSLSGLCTSDRYERASHTYGKAYRDVVRGLRGDFSPAPDLVAQPATETDVVALLDWCSESGVAVIPYGGGSSVVGGVEADVPDSYTGTVSLDLSKLNSLVEIDTASRAAYFQAGILGPALEDALRPHGLTLRHYPQSFEFSSLGGWIATRSAGHFATRVTHIDDFVESLRVVTPRGVIETRRLPASGAGPSPDRLYIGSEGTLGVVTEAWMRLQDRPVHRASTSVTFPTFTAGAEACRLLVQSGSMPANCRLLDPVEALNNGAGDGTLAVLLLGFESAHRPVERDLAEAVECVRDAGGTPGEITSGRRDETSGAWRSAFLRMPYLRDAVARLGIISETIETAITWDSFEDCCAEVLAATEAATVEACGSRGLVACRLTHVYSDGAAPYFTILAPGGVDPVAAWDAIKAAASEAILEAGATITHHHSVGRTHRAFYDAQRPSLYADVIWAAKAALDPGMILNPGVLVDP